MGRGSWWVVAAACCCVVGLAAPTVAQVCGDADGGGSVTVSDGVQVLRAAAGLGDCELARCDVDGNGSVTVSDGVQVLRAAADIIELNGCSGNALGARRGFLQALTNAIVLPRYRALANQAVGLEVAVNDLVSTPGGEKLAIAQDEWRATRLAWRETEAFRVGPSEFLQTAARVDDPTAATEDIDAVVGGSSPLSSALLDTFDPPLVGLQAIEYFLFDPSGGDAAVVMDLAGPVNGRRRGYLAVLATNVRERLEELRDAWEPAGGNFGADFVASGQGDTTFPTLDAAFDAVVNRLVVTADDVANEKLGKPLGAAGGGPRPDLVETPRSGDAVAGIAGELAGIDLVYRTALGAVVRPLDGAVDAEIRQLLADALDAVGAIPTPLADAVVHHRDDVQAAYEAVQRLRDGLAGDLTALLGVTVAP